MYIIYIFVDGVTPYGIAMLPPKYIGYPTEPPASGMGRICLIRLSELPKRFPKQYRLVPYACIYYLFVSEGRNCSD